MGTLIMMIVVAIYVYICIRATDRVENFIESILDKIDFNIDLHPIVSMIILGFFIAFIAKLFWPLIVAIGLGLLAFYWFKDRDVIKNLFKDLF